MARQLTERQQKFLDVLFEEAGGDMVMAKKWLATQKQVLPQKLSKA